MRKLYDFNVLALPFSLHRNKDCLQSDIVSMLVKTNKVTLSQNKQKITEARFSPSNENMETGLKHQGNCN